MGRTVALSLLLNAARLVAGAAVDTNSRNTLSLSAGGVSGSEQQQGSSNCVSISEAANDFWCATNCGKDGHCPPSICKCGVDLDTGNITAEQMDYLKSSSRNAEKYSKEVPCLTMEEVAKARGVLCIWTVATEPVPAGGNHCLSPTSCHVESLDNSTCAGVDNRHRANLLHECHRDVRARRGHRRGQLVRHS